MAKLARMRTCERCYMCCTAGQWRR